MAFFIEISLLLLMKNKNFVFFMKIISKTYLLNDVFSYTIYLNHLFTKNVNMGKNERSANLVKKYFVRNCVILTTNNLPMFFNSAA